MKKGIVLIVLAASFWGLGGVAGQYLFQYHGADPVWLVMARQVVSGTLFLLYAALVLRQNIFQALAQNLRSLLYFSFVGILGAQLGYYYAISLCNAATATVLQYSAPIWVMAYMSYKRRTLPDGRELVGIVGAVLGVFLIATHGSFTSLALSPTAIAVGLLSAVSYAFYSVQPVKLLQRYPTTLVIGWGQSLSGLSLIALRAPLPAPGNWDAHAYFALAYLVLGATIASYALYLGGLKIVGSTKASLVSCAEPLASILAVVFLLDTQLVLPDYIGMACIIFTVLLLAR